LPAPPYHQTRASFFPDSIIPAEIVELFKDHETIRKLMHKPSIQLNKMFGDQTLLNPPKQKGNSRGPNLRRSSFQKKREREEQAFEIIRRILQDRHCHHEPHAASIGGP